MRYPKALFIVYKYNSRMIKDIAYESTKVFKTWESAYNYINKIPWGKSAKFIIAEQKEEDIYIYKNPKKQITFGIDIDKNKISLIYTIHDDFNYLISEQENIDNDRRYLVQG